VGGQRIERQEYKLGSPREKVVGAAGWAAYRVLELEGNSNFGGVNPTLSVYSRNA